MLKVLGAEQPSPLAPYLAKARGIDDLEQLPPLAESQAAWTAAAHALRERVERLTAADLDAASAARFPVSEQKVLNVFAFLVQHETYHLGQLALLRKHAGLPAMSYA
jgi:uncharacterized damage-inducible protein DinB